MSNLFAIAMYVLQALGLYTIAQRRGIKNPWLAWIPFGSAWILGCIYDDYKGRCGKQTKFRVINLALSIAVVVLAFAVLITLFSTLLGVLSRDEVLDIVAFSANPAGDLYSPTEEEFVEQLSQILEKRLSDARIDALLGASLAAVGLSVVLLGVAIGAMVVECLCMYNLFESCDPANKLVFFLVGLFVGLWPVFVFVVRNKDLGLPQGLPGGYENAQTKEPWNF